MAVIHDRLRPHHVPDEPRLLADHAPHALEGGVCPALEHRRRGRRRIAGVHLVRQGEGLELPVAVDHHPVAVHRMQLRTPGDGVADRIHPRCLRGRSDDRQAILRIIAGNDPGEHQRHAGGRRIRRVYLRGGRRPEQVRVTDRRQVQRMRVHRIGMHGGRLGAAAGQIGDDECGLYAEPQCQDPGGNARTARQQERAPAFLRRQALEPGSRVHGEKSMSLNVVLKAAGTPPRHDSCAPRHASSARHHTGVTLVLSSDCFCRSNYYSFWQACVAVSRPL